MRKIAILPTLLTLGNAICGFASVAIASKIGTKEIPEAEYPQLFALAGSLIFAGMVFDVFDGMAARLSKTASKFGGELDSLADAITFGLAPAFLLLKMGPGWTPRPFLHQLLAGIAAIYMCCTVLRLARFNVDNSPDPSSHKRFKGLPSPGAAGCVASLAIFRGTFPRHLTSLWPDIDPATAQAWVEKFVELVCPFGALVVALLMVSMVPYPHAANRVFRGKKHVGHLIQILMSILIIYLAPELVLFVLFWGYALGMPAWNIIQGYFPKPSPDVPNPETR